MKSSITIGIGIAVVIAAILGITVYTTAESSPQTSDTNTAEPISFEEETTAEISSGQKTIGFNAIDKFGLEEESP